MQYIWFYGRKVLNFMEESINRKAGIAGPVNTHGLSHVANSVEVARLGPTNQELRRKVWRSGCR